jgi:hypothetical protein
LPSHLKTLPPICNQENKMAISRRVPVVGAAEINEFEKRLASLREQHKALAADLSVFLLKHGCMHAAGEVLVHGASACSDYHTAIQAFIGRGFTERDAP